MKKHTSGPAGAQRALVRAFDPDLNEFVMIPESETLEIKVITGLKGTADGWLMTPSAVRQMGFGRSPLFEYPEVEDPTIVLLAGMTPPGTDIGGVATTYWQAAFFRADGIRQSLVITDLADARDPLFDALPEDQLLDLAAPFLGRREAA